MLLTTRCVFRSTTRIFPLRTSRLATRTSMSSKPPNMIRNPLLLVCDLQEKFRSAIHEFDKVVGTTQKMITASQVLSIPILATTQNARALGPLVSELGIPAAGDESAPDGTKLQMLAPVVDKTLFSMVTPTTEEPLQRLAAAAVARSADGQKLDAIIVGIEAHICVTQTTLDLLSRGHNVYVLADGVSSCNREEVPIALRRLAAAGATVSSSESVLYEIMRDASIPEFRKIAGLVKESKGATAAALQALCKI